MATHYHPAPRTTTDNHQVGVGHMSSRQRAAGASSHPCASISTGTAPWCGCIWPRNWSSSRHGLSGLFAQVRAHVGIAHSAALTALRRPQISLSALTVFVAGSAQGG